MTKPIDITRPQDYQFKNKPGYEIKGFIERLSSDYPLLANYIDKEGAYHNSVITADGFYHSEKTENNYNVILRPEIAARQEKMIDLTKKYKTVGGVKVLSIKDMKNGCSQPLEALLNEGAIARSVWYTKNGRRHVDGTISPMDLILDEDALRQEEVKEVKQRKVVQIIPLNQGIAALCDDGKIFTNWNNNDWQAWKNVPQD